MRKKNRILCLLMTVIISQVFISSCAKLNEEEILDNFRYCKEDSVSFQNNVLPILNMDCNSCHAGPNAEEGVELTDYTNVQLYAGSGDLMGVLDHVSGLAPMPYGKPKLNDCKIETIRKWIEEGMQDN